MYVGSVVNSTIGAGAPYIFTTNKHSNDGISYDAATGTFTFRYAGLYKISFTTSAGGTGNITPTLYKNGVASTYELASMTSTGNTDLVSGAFTTILEVTPALTDSYATIQVLDAGVAATTTIALITIDRIA